MGEHEADEDRGGADLVIAALASVPASRNVLEQLPEVLRPPPDERGSVRLRQVGLTIQDAWGRRLRCLTDTSPFEVDRQAVAANGGKPVFISAGPDRRFGVRDPASAADNLVLLPSPRR